MPDNLDTTPPPPSETTIIFSPYDIAGKLRRNPTTIWRLARRICIPPRYKTESGHCFYDEKQVTEIEKALTPRRAYP